MSGLARGGWLTCCVVLAVGWVAADEPKEIEVARGKEAFELVSRYADSYLFERVPEAGDRTPLKRQTTPLLRWSNPEVGSIHGAIFLWTIDERPMLVGSLFKWFEPKQKTEAEIHSLCEEPLEGHRENKLAWTTEGKAIRFQELEKAPVPAEQPRQRLAQIKSLVAEISAVATFPDKNRIPLRSMTRELYRYSSPKNKIIDGALFAFTRGTDPELLVLIEARETANGPRWHAAFSRMNAEASLVVRRADKELYHDEEPNWGLVSNNKGLYNILLIEAGK